MQYGKPLPSNSFKNETFTERYTIAEVLFRHILLLSIFSSILHVLPRVLLSVTPLFGLIGVRTIVFNIFTKESERTYFIIQLHCETASIQQ